MSDSTPQNLRPTDTFVRRHLGPSDAEVEAMLQAIGLGSLDELVAATVPASIRLERPLSPFTEGEPRGEHELLGELAEIASGNQVSRSFLGQGYHGTITPPVIQRNILENPGWYTQYTPYQAEISQGRLEALLVYQTMIQDLTGLPLANASLLDEGTAAAEAMTLCARAKKKSSGRFLVAAECHPQTIAILETRAEALGFEIVVTPAAEFAFDDSTFGCLIQYPTTDGRVLDDTELVERAHQAGALVVCAADLLSLVLLRSPGEIGCDVAVGSAQRFGVPMGFGGPHAAFFATKEQHKRNVPGRIIGVSKDAHGRPALRMAMQTREQHIRRDKATSNICTAQVLLAIMAGMYAVYHGPEGLTAIARRVHELAGTLAAGLKRLGIDVSEDAFFDTVRVTLDDTRADQALGSARARGINLRRVDGGVCVALDESATADDVRELLQVFGGDAGSELDLDALAAEAAQPIPAPFARTDEILTHEVFHRYHSEHEMLRYLRRLESRDLSLTTSMIPLGSCTMKLNATSEMLPVTWPEWGNLHPFAPREDTRGYLDLFRKLERALCEITGFDAMSLQPNAGSQGEYAGLLVIRAYHRANGDGDRDVCLIPVSAHGTNPASAVLAGMRVVAVACDDQGNVDLDDLKAKAEAHSDRLGALMITYPSTHGVFEEEIRAICDTVHAHGGQVYMDGANMNAQVGLCRPAEFGADVAHLNLHKTFCIPHGGGGPGMGPIGVVEHLAPFLPGHPVVQVGGPQATGAVSAAPWGSPSILVIPWVYIALMGAEGLKRATEIAILNANYMAKRLEEHYDVLYRGANGRVAHEFILDLRPFETSAGIAGEDVAKRLMDYGFHAPTMSFPVAGTLMIEPTESESRAELDRLVDALIAIRAEIRAIEEGRMDREDNPLQNAPHTMHEIAGETWSHPYSREEAAFPAPWVKDSKFWPAVSRVDNGYGDRNLVCACPPMEAYAEPANPPSEPEPALHQA